MRKLTQGNTRKTPGGNQCVCPEKPTNKKNGGKAGLGTQQRGQRRKGLPLLLPGGGFQTGKAKTA